MFRIRLLKLHSSESGFCPFLQTALENMHMGTSGRWNICYVHVGVIGIPEPIPYLESGFYSVGSVTSGLGRPTVSGLNV
jgi:hypothetical protein